MDLVELFSYPFMQRALLAALLTGLAAQRRLAGPGGGRLVHQGLGQPPGQVGREVVAGIRHPLTVGVGGRICPQLQQRKR